MFWKINETDSKMSNKGAKLELMDKQLVRTNVLMQEFLEKFTINYYALAECLKIINISFL